jgi:hypothetical protein
VRSSPPARKVRVVKVPSTDQTPSRSRTCRTPDYLCSNFSPGQTFHRSSKTKNSPTSPPTKVATYAIILGDLGSLSERHAQRSEVHRSGCAPAVGREAGRAFFPTHDDLLVVEVVDIMNPAGWQPCGVVTRCRETAPRHRPRAGARPY